MRLHGEEAATGDAHPPRARDAAATRDDLLRAAKRRFTLSGYERTTTRDIAADAGVNVSLIARYFGSKDGLFNAVLQATAGSMQFQGSDDLVEDVLAGLRPGAWPEYGGQHPLLLLLRDDADDARTAQLRRRTLDQTAEVLGRQIAGATQDSPADARLRGASVLAFLAGIVTVRAVLRDDTFEPADEVVRPLLIDVVRAIRNSALPTRSVICP